MGKADNMIFFVREMPDCIVFGGIIIASDNNSLLEPPNTEHLSPQSENLTKLLTKKDCFAMGSVWLTSLDNDHYVFVSMVFFAFLFHTLLYLF